MALILVGVGRVAWVMWLSPDARYKAEVRQMREQIMAAIPRDRPLESLNREDRGRVEVGRALQTALANARCEYGAVSREKVRAIAAELRRTHGEILRTREGAYRLWLQLEDACPELREYSWIVDLREMQADGTIPKFNETPPAAVRKK